MRNLLLSATAAALLGLAYGASPASAVPAHPVQIAAPDSGIEKARTTKRKKVVRSRAKRGTATTTTGTTGGATGVTGGTAGATGGNVGQPSRAVPQTRGSGPGAGGGGAGTGGQ